MSCCRSLRKFQIEYLYAELFGTAAKITMVITLQLLGLYSDVLIFPFFFLVGEHVKIEGRIFSEYYIGLIKFGHVISRRHRIQGMLK